MQKKINVGKSSKTPFKHWILDVELGRQVGVLSLASWKVPCKANPNLLIIDMCAGDGKESEFSDKTSPSIISKHMDFNKLKSRAIFIEKSQLTFNELINNVNQKEGMEFLNIDAKNFIPPVINDNQAVFINCDPNSVDEIPLTADFMNKLNQYSTMIITLGCNVAGLKRLERKRRDEWFDYTNLMIKNLPQYHDLLLCWIKRDCSQWAYLVRIPKVWSAGSKDKYLKKGSKMLNHGIGVISFNNETDSFYDKLNDLFLTKKENENEE